MRVVRGVVLRVVLHLREGVVRDAGVWCETPVSGCETPVCGCRGVCAW